MGITLAGQGYCGGSGLHIIPTWTSLCFIALRAYCSVDPQLIESARQTGSQERNENGGGYERMGTVGREHVTSISPWATSSSAGQTEEDKLRPLSLPLPFSISLAVLVL